MSTAVPSTRWNDAVEARLNELSLVTMGLAGMLEGLDHAVDIAKMGGITDKRLDAVMHLANTRQMTPTTERVLADAGIDTTPWAVVTGEQKMVRADAIVIERGELPPVEPDEEDEVTLLAGMTYRLGEKYRAQWDEAREMVLNILAIRAYWDAHPPVPPVSDEDVETLAGLLNEVDPDHDVTYRVARRLLATGRVAVAR